MLKASTPPSSIIFIAVANTLSAVTGALALPTPAGSVFRFCATVSYLGS